METHATQRDHTKTRRFRFRGALCFAALLQIPNAIAAAEIISFQVGNSGWHMGTLAVGNVEGSSQPEIVIPYRDGSGHWFLDAFKPDGTRLSGFPYSGGSEEINTSPSLYDLDGDGRAEIIFTHGARVIALRGNGTQVWSTTINNNNYIPNGGYMTVTNGFYWSNGGGFIPTLPASAVFSSQISSPIIADINGDGVKEVATAWKIDPDSTSTSQDFNPFINDIFGFAEWGTVGEVWSGGVAFFNATTGAKTHIYHIHQLVESGLALGQADADNPLEVYVLNDSDSVVCFDKTKPHGFYGNGTLHKQFGKNQRLMSGAYQQPVDVHTVDIDGDGLSEVLVPTTQLNPLWQPNETILDDDGAILWRKWKQPASFPQNQWQNSACMIPVNPDRDNHIDVLSYTHSHEINFRYWNGIGLVDRPGWPKNFYPHLPTPPVVGDVDGDGAEEIVIGTYDPTQNPSSGTLYVYNLNGTLQTSLAVPGGLKHIPMLADANGDGGLDVTYRSLSGRVYIHNFGAIATSPVSWATHRGNAQRNGNFAASLFPVGTPLITRKETGYRRASFSWGGAATNTATAWRIFRADEPGGPFTHIATVAGNTTSYVDELLQPGCQYIYEVGAVIGSSVVRSAPFAVLSSLNGNIVANGGFEEDDNSHWDKWFTGDIEWTNMVSGTYDTCEGRKSMEVTLVNKGNSGSISQYSQYGTPDAVIPVTPGKLYSFGGYFKSDGISQPSEHWLEWGSAITGEDPNQRPVRPYPLYFTPHFVIGSETTDWTYVNRTFEMPAGFPNVELTHRYSISSPGSGRIRMDNLFFRSLPSPNATNWIQLLPFGSTWRFFALPPPANWFAADFNDSLWPIGYAKFGVGGGPANVVTPVPPFQPAYFFRRTFDVPSGSLEELLLSATCTDAGGKLDIYINGEKLNTSAIDPVSAQGNEVKYYDLTPFIPLLKPGQNVIAIGLQNQWQSWDDVAFDINLKAVPYTPAQAAFKSIHRQAGAIALELAVPAKTNWRIESTDDLATPDWRLMQLVTGDSSGTLNVIDIGQNGRLAPPLVKTRFYRMVPD
jgi:hypothetical protein